MLIPETLKASPAENYDDLKRQFFALRKLCESKTKQCSIYSKKLAEYDRESVIARNEVLNSEREMNAQLTAELEKVEQRCAELEKERDHAQRMYNSLLGDLSVGYGALSIPECESHLNKFALEQRQEAVEEYKKSDEFCKLLDSHFNSGKVYGHNEYYEQLRKEQEK